MSADEVPEDLDGIEDDEIEDLDDVDFDPDVDAQIEPGLDDELVDDPSLDAEDAAIERSLSVSEGEEDEPPAAVIELDQEVDEDDEDDEDERGEVVDVDEDVDEDVDGLREGEFICTSCYLAKGPSQLADAERQICVDCV